MSGMSTAKQCVYVEWIDSASMYGWHDVDSAVAPIEIRTVGWLLKSTPKHVTISASQSDAGNADSPISIPRKAITKLTRFELPG